MSLKRASPQKLRAKRCLQRVEQNNCATRELLGGGIQGSMPRHLNIRMIGRILASHRRLYMIALSDFFDFADLYEFVQVACKTT